LQEETEAAAAVFNASAVYGAACAAAFPNTLWRCLMGQYRMPFLKTPYLANEAQFDSFQLPFNEGAPPPYNTSGMAYALSFQAAMAAEAASLPTAAQANSSFFSAACYKHCVTDNANFWSIGINGVSLRDVAFDWWAGLASTPRRVVDSCVGWKCGMCRENLNKTERISRAQAASVRAVIRSESAQEAAVRGAGAAPLVLSGGSEEAAEAPGSAPATHEQNQPTLTRKQQARMHKRQARKQERSSTPDTYVLQARVEALALAVICATLACIIFSYRTVLSAFVDVDRSVAGILAKERAPMPERPDSPNALYGPVRPGYATFAPAADAHAEDAGGDAQSRYVPMSAAVSAGAAEQRSMGARGGYATSSTASLSLERWRPSPSASPALGGAAPRPVSPYGSVAPPNAAAPGAPPQPGTWAAAAAAARMAAEAAQAQAQAAADAASGMVAGVVPPAWQPPPPPPAWQPPPPAWQAQGLGAPLQPWQAAQAAQAAAAQQPPQPHRPAAGWQGGGGAAHLGDAL
jgi:hypothetical protein